MNNPLTQSVNKLRQHPEYLRSVIQLYRQLLRNSQRLKKLDIPDASILYEELKMGMYEAFTKRYTNTYQLTQAFVKGILVHDALDDAVSNGNIDKLMHCVHQHRKDYFDWSQRRSSFLRNRKELEDKRITALRGKESSLAMSRKRGKLKLAIPDLSTDESIQQFITKGFETASKNGQSLILRYLNQLQYAGKIPNPHLLPYTPDTLQTSGDQYDPHHVIKGSTQKIVDKSFDKEYIESIIIPGLTFDLNDLHMEKITTIVNKKGPYRATAKENKSGTVPLPYVMSPFKYKPGRKQMAYLIRQQVLWFRIRKIWGATHELEEENRGKDGSYPIRGSRGFGAEELMKPREYYEKLALGEEVFQLFCEIERRRAAGGDFNEEIDLGKFDWTRDLDTVSEEIEAKYNSILRESKLDLSQLQKSLQERYDEGYRDKVERFTNLLDSLKENRVFKHSEVVTPPGCSLLKNSLPRSATFEKFPAEERIGRGKMLGDFLRDNDFRYFEFGNELRKNINEIMTKIVHRF
ncbi:hypothetical protein KGF57_001011 [Candida theae]|uniref:Uncharacterized protein n=1 Tax=Candida theae TaxID=1198502 RepID=A0AAD5BIF4_9ASCO|nr:uncharacterized protein KGF57_001011 [Candida theae]KAI5964519.1 hypothetical protein KGF57_001011 [Candida theae]